MDDPNASAKDGNNARRILANIARDAEKSQADRMKQFQNMAAIMGSPLSLEEQERAQMAALTAVCEAHTSEVAPLQGKIDSSMDPLVLATLLVRNQDFLKRLLEFELTAQNLNTKGRPQLLQTLKGWEHTTQATNSMIQYVFHTRQPATPVAMPVAMPAPAPVDSPVDSFDKFRRLVPAAAFNQRPVAAPAQLNQQAMVGIWDLTMSDGVGFELALDNTSFSYFRLDKTFALWGAWSLDTSGPTPLLCTTRQGGYPVAFYGSAGVTLLSQTIQETWGITAFQPDRISFGTTRAVRRAPIQLALVTARISAIQAEFVAADIRDQGNARLMIARNIAVRSVQDSMWDYINSGAGRPRF